MPTFAAQSSCLAALDLCRTVFEVLSQRCDLWSNLISAAIACLRGLAASEF